MRAYLSVLSARFRVLLQYRAAAWAGFGTQCFFGLIRIMIFTGFYFSSLNTQPLSYSQMISYVWLGQALFALIPFRVDADIEQMIRSGDICYEILRPVRLYAYWFARAVAQRTAPVMLRALPMVVLAAFVFPLVGAENWALHAPASLPAFLLFLVSVFAAVLLACTLSLLMSVSLFWTIAADGVSNLFPVIIWNFCGILLPLPFFPDWAQPLFNALPFRGLMDVPFRIYIGSIPLGPGLGEIGIQFLWILALAILGSYLLSRGLAKVVVQGG